MYDSSKGSALISQLHHITATYSSLALNLVLKSLQSVSRHDPGSTVPRTTARLPLGLKQFLVVHVSHTDTSNRLRVGWHQVSDDTRTARPRDTDRLT